MSGRQKFGSAMTMFGYLVYILTGFVVLGSLFNGCVALFRGSFVELIFSVGLAVVIGFIGQFVAGLLMASGEGINGSN